MTSAVTKLFISLVFLSIFSAGCSDRFQKGSHLYLIPFMNTDGSYTWKEVELTTLDSPIRLSGSTGSIHYKPTANNFRDWGPAVEPKMTKSGNVWVPLDPSSALALSAYANLEAIRRWEEFIHPKTQNVYPRKLVLDVLVRTSNGQITDNAMYVPFSDSVLVVPYTKSGLPLSVNQGIMTHEHFHVQFFHNLLASAYGKYAEKESEHNENVLGAWNEGLADFYAYVFTQQPRFMDISKILPPQYALVRALDFDFESLSESFMYENSSEDLKLNDAKNTCVSGSHYCLGTQIGRLLYQMSQGSPSKATNLIRKIYEKFPQWEKNIYAKYFNDKLQPNDFLKWTFDNEKSALDPVQTDLLRKAGVTP